MKIGVPREVKVQEHRVGLVPSSVEELVHHGHTVMVESGLGAGIGIAESAYREAGALVVDSHEEVFAHADMIVKVKEPQAEEYLLLREGQVLFTYLHLAADKPQAEALARQGVTAVAYETVTDASGQLPLLKPMSEIAGRLSIQAGAACLEKVHGGAGILLGGVAGVSAAKVVIIGGGVVGTNALRMAVGMGAIVYVLDKSLERLRQLDNDFGNAINTVYATRQAVGVHCADADLVIGAVLVPGAAAPKLVRQETVSAMRPGTVVVDVAIDQGGCVETSKPTTYDNPTFTVDDVVHYCVTNMPGAVARTSAFALNNATLPFVLALANKGVAQAMGEDPHLKNGLNIEKGKIIHPAVAAAFAAQDG